MKESDLLSYALTCLKQSGLVYWRVVNQATRHAGVMKKSPIKGFPDIAGLMPNGKFWAAEIKTDVGKLSKEQIEWITKINMSNGFAVVLRSKEEIKTFIEALLKFNQS